MIGYLLDTNIISRLIVQEPNARANLDAVAKDGSFIRIPTIAIAEIYEGMMRGGNHDPLQEERVYQFCESYEAIDFSKATIPDYALLRAELFHQHATKESRGYKEKVLEQLFHRLTGKQLGIDERDLQIASIAVEKKLVLATADRNIEMRNIEAASLALVQRGEKCVLMIADWTKAPVCREGD